MLLKMPAPSRTHVGRVIVRRVYMMPVPLTNPTNSKAFAFSRFAAETLHKHRLDALLTAQLYDNKGLLECAAVALLLSNTGQLSS